MLTCPTCGHEEPESSRFCTRCGTSLLASFPSNPPVKLSQREREEMNLSILYAMVGVLVLALLCPPWQTPPGRPPEFLGFHFVLSPPDADHGDAIVSRLLLTVELVTIAVAGLYFSWLFRKRD